MLALSMSLHNVFKSRSLFVLHSQGQKEKIHSLISLQSFIFLLSLSLSRSLVGRLCWFRRWLLCLDRGADGSARFVFAAEGLVGFDGAAMDRRAFLVLPMER